MAHTKNCFVILIAFFLLAGCSHQTQQEQTGTAPAIQAAPGNTTVVNSEVFSIASLNEAYINSITQTFTVKRKRVTIVTGKKGLKVTVNPARLETADGQPVEGDITVKIVELTSSEDLFRSNAATMSNGRLLASGGSYYVGMECDGKPLRIKGNQSLQMEFPRIKQEDMELFYGNRDTEGNINWVKANEPLEFTYTTARTTEYNPPFPGNEERKRFKSRFKLYSKLTDTVYYQDKLMSIDKLVHTLKTKGVDKNIDTLLIPACDFYYGLEYNRNYTYDTIKRYRIVSCRDIDEDNAHRQAEQKITAQRDEANRKYNMEWWKHNDDNTLEGKLQRYYAPSSVNKLGWINCDRFYQAPQLIETPVEIPYTFNDPSIQYFLIYKSMNGLMSGRLVKNKKEQYVLSNLPAGEKVTIIAFTRQNGVIYNCKEEFTIAAGKTIQPEFKTISAEEMNKMFGSNIRI